jgi:hypothetical protein
MEKIIILIITFFANIITFAQVEIADCIIIIDKKVDLNIQVNIQIQDKNFQNDTIKCFYRFCSLKISEEDWNKLQKINDSTIVNINVVWSYRDENYLTEKYDFNRRISLNHLRDMRVINITTFNKKKSIYFFDIIGDGYRTKHGYEKKYGKRRSFYKKIII